MATPFIFSLEDSDVDYLLLELALKDCLGPVDLRRTTDGEQAIAVLKQAEVSIDQPRPDLFLLDINTPRLNGLEVLRFIRDHDFVRHIPVVMFTSSRDLHEKRKALALGAEEFVIKPSNLDGMLKALNEICIKYLKGSPVT